ncbi:KdsC family phosphatase [Chromobacterium sphagni]|uniref:3-deoxy-manno-octulosonate-8-phosphatase n=1 Tax=Chromobacterium sphagni TaxID=1903179 RepID=A0ABX3C8N7_9NEIS|nr:HAD family hydrolase [Chromobacterium sphagni]OHX17669.1 hypothetical protein BI344_20645 [Chromobacterium sphagni]
MSAAAPIRAVLLDVDGTLTDGRFAWGAQGEVLRHFSFKDVMGISRWRRKGVLFALVSGESDPALQRFADKVGIPADLCYLGYADKGEALDDVLGRHGLRAEQVAMMGDDVNDLPVMARVGFSAAPADAVDAVREAVTMLSTRNGGYGAVREVLDHLGRAGRLPASDILRR